MGSLDTLPYELFRLILTNLSLESLRRVSLINWRYRVATTPILFRVVKFEFSGPGLEGLQQLARSHIAGYVKELHYEALPLVNPYLRHPEYFTSYIQTPQEYERDLRNMNWNGYGQRFSYSKVHSYFKDMATDQHDLMNSKRDLSILCGALLRLSCLRTIRLSFGQLPEVPYLWFANRVFVDRKISDHFHLNHAVTAIEVACCNGIPIQCVEISSFYAGLPRLWFDQGISALLTRALAQIRCVRLLDSMSLLGVLSKVPMPDMRRVEIGKCWLVESDLDSFFRAHSGTLRSLQFIDVFLPRSKALPAGSRTDGLTDRICKLVNKGYGGNLKNLTLKFDSSQDPALLSVL